MKWKIKMKKIATKFYKEIEEIKFDRQKTKKVK